MPQPDPTNSFAFTQWSRTSAAARSLRAQSIWLQLLAVAALLVLVPLIIAIVIVIAVMALALAVIRAVWVRAAGLMPRRDGRENVRVITRR